MTTMSRRERLHTIACVVVEAVVFWSALGAVGFAIFVVGPAISEGGL